MRPNQIRTVAIEHIRMALTQLDTITHLAEDQEARKHLIEAQMWLERSATFSNITQAEQLVHAKESVG